MTSKFRNELINNNSNFKNIFDSLISDGKIEEFPDKLWKLINSDKSSIIVNGVPYAFKDLFHLNLIEGRCMLCVFHLVLLLDKVGIYSEAIECVNENFIGTSGSVYGGHWYVQVSVFDTIICIDTSLMIMGSVESFETLGHKTVNKYDIDTLFKKYPSLIDYHDELIINERFL